MLALNKYQAALRLAGVKSPGHARVVAAILRERKIRRVSVPQNFPLALAVELRRLRIAVTASRGAVFPQRERKRPEEVKKISAALMMAEVGMSEAMQVLRAAKIGRDRRLLHHNVPLTSEKLRSVIDCAILQASGLAANTIVAGGRQGCDPHERGFGPLKAHEPIIIDIFPRSQKTGYFGDITRTVVRGRASEGVRRLYDTVQRGQDLAFKRVRDVRPRGTSTSQSPGFLTPRAIPPAGVTGAWRVFSTGPGTDWDWKFTKRRAWGRSPTGDWRPVTWSPLSRDFTIRNSVACVSRMWPW